MAVMHSILSMKLRKLEGLFENNLKTMHHASDSEMEDLMNAQQLILRNKILVSAELGRIVLR
jgi:adenosyl cobinamide kinase/adenosyl cobinamide phosphate guanylyltransferase